MIIKTLYKQSLINNLRTEIGEHKGSPFIYLYHIPITHSLVVESSSIRFWDSYALLM